MLCVDISLFLDIKFNVFTNVVYIHMTLLETAKNILLFTLSCFFTEKNLTTELQNYAEKKPVLSFPPSENMEVKNLLSLMFEELLEQDQLLESIEDWINNPSQKNFFKMTKNVDTECLHKSFEEAKQLQWGTPEKISFFKKILFIKIIQSYIYTLDKYNSSERDEKAKNELINTVNKQKKIAIWLIKDSVFSNGEFQKKIRDFLKQTTEKFNKMNDELGNIFTQDMNICSEFLKNYANSCSDE